MIQLLNIEEKFRSEGMTLEFITMYGHTIETVKNYLSNHLNFPKNFYYVIKLSPETVYRLAAKYGFHLYNLKHKV
jgi:hypothetical protein